MTSSGPGSAIEEIAGAADAVYFFMFPGWSDELRSNRWHYARRWARHLPVVLVQPERPVRRGWRVEAEPRIANAEILSVAGPAGPPEFARRSLSQAAQIMQHMRERGYERPIAWFYNPWLAGAYGAIPCVGRIFHATENYFDFESVDPFFLQAKALALETSDLVVAVSRGVAESLMPHVDAERVAVISNGCDLEEYRPDGPQDAELSRLKEPFDQAAVYAGNINARLDFGLLGRIAAEQPRTLFAIYGPVSSLGGDDAAAWKAALAHRNVAHLGRVDPARLPALYRAADLGIIPYKRTPGLVRNGFPLKALEMCATGLPVVSTHMESLVGLAEALVVATDDESFAAAAAKNGRACLSDAQRAELGTLCAANDYDLKFEEVARISATFLVDARTTTRLDSFVAFVGAGSWLELCVKYARTYAAMRAEASAATYSAIGQMLPEPVRHAIPPRVRDRIRRRFAAS